MRVDEEFTATILSIKYHLRIWVIMVWAGEALNAHLPDSASREILVSSFPCHVSARLKREPLAQHRSPKLLLAFRTAFAEPCDFPLGD